MQATQVERSVVTVLGSVAANALGRTLIHEHLFIDLSVWQTPAGDNAAREVAALPVASDTIAIVRRDPFAVRANLFLHDEDLACTELEHFLSAGGRTVVDLTLDDIGRNPAALRRVALRTGATIVMGCGHYIGAAHPDGLAAEGEEGIAARLLRELLVGVSVLDGPPVRAGVIGEIGTSDPITAAERTVLRAAARVQKQTGAPLFIHLDPWGHAGHQALDIAEKAGAELSRVALCHLDATLPDSAYHRSLAARGATVCYDIWGDEDDYGGKGMPTDLQRVQALETAMAEGWIDRVAVSHDVCTLSQLRVHGGPGYGHLLSQIMPLLRQRGHGPELGELLLVETPRRLLAWEQ